MIDWYSYVDLALKSSNNIEPLFFQIGIIIVFAAFLGFILKILRQPVIPAYVIAGVLLGPYCFKLITNTGVMETLSEMGIAFLLFVVGMELNLSKLRSIGLIAIAGSTIQVFILGLSGFFIGQYLGFDFIESIYISLILSFSSTMVVVKLLSDKAEIDTLHGKISIGFLVMEDLFAIIALLIITNIKEIQTIGVAPMLVIMTAKIILLILFTLIFSKYVMPFFFRHAAKSGEVLFLLSITVCFIFAFITSFIGLSISVGAFIGGLSIAKLPYTYDIIGKIKSLRIFFITIFFAALGMKLNFDLIKIAAVPLLTLVIFISLLKPMITALICSLFGYKRRTALLTAISLSQTSEFSLVIVSLGLSAEINHLSSGSIIPTIAILLSIITMVITSYTIKFDLSIYEKIKNGFKFLDKIGGGRRELPMMSHLEMHNALLIGYDRIGYQILKTMKKMGLKPVVVDLNPDITSTLTKRDQNEGVTCIYGDASDSEVLERLELGKCKLIVSTAPAASDNLVIIKHAKAVGSKAVIFVTASRVDDALELYSNGADYVILPHFLGGNHVSLLLEEESLDIDKILYRKMEHITELKHRKTLGHEHPATNPT